MAFTSAARTRSTYFALAIAALLSTVSTVNAAFEIDDALVGVRVARIAAVRVRAGERHVVGLLNRLLEERIDILIGIERRPARQRRIDL